MQNSQRFPENVISVRKEKNPISTSHHKLPLLPTPLPQFYHNEMSKVKCESSGAPVLQLRARLFFLKARFIGFLFTLRFANLAQERIDQWNTIGWSSFEYFSCKGVIWYFPIVCLPPPHQYNHSGVNKYRSFSFVHFFLQYLFSNHLRYSKHVLLISHYFK